MTDGAGAPLLDALVDPGEPIPAEASAVHGIGDEDVRGAPDFGAVLERLTGAVEGRRVLVYNMGFDLGVLRHELTLHYRERVAPSGEGGERQAAAWLELMRWEDVMMPYSEWRGEWSDYHGGYRWQPLGGGHRGLEDCRAVLECLRAMAGPVPGAGELEAAAGCGGMGCRSDGAVAGDDG